MSDLVEAITAARRALDPLDLRYALVGGFAVSVRTAPRFTRDIDLAVAVEDDERAEALVGLLLTDGHVLMANIEHEAAGRLATSRLRLRGGQILDLLFASSGIESEIASAADLIEVLPGLDLPVAGVGHLLALKLLARDDATRPQDAGDIGQLVIAATDDDLVHAAEAVTLIEKRGFARGRDLVAALADATATRES